MKQITVFSMVSKFARIKKKSKAKEMPKGKEFKIYPSNLSCVSISEKSIQTKEGNRKTRTVKPIDYLTPLTRQVTPMFNN